jgi:hypothetical protein
MASQTPALRAVVAPLAVAGKQIFLFFLCSLFFLLSFVLIVVLGLHTNSLYLHTFSLTNVLHPLSSLFPKPNSFDCVRPSRLDSFGTPVDGQLGYRLDGNNDDEDLDSENFNHGSDWVCDTSAGYSNNGPIGGTVCSGAGEPYTLTGCSPPPPAKCSSIPSNDIDAFCADDGANGLLDSAFQLDCDADPCVKSDDAARCCKPVLPEIVSVCSFAEPAKCLVQGGGTRRRLDGHHRSEQSGPSKTNLNSLSRRRLCGTQVCSSADNCQGGDPCVDGCCSPPSMGGQVRTSDKRTI